MRKREFIEIFKKFDWIQNNLNGKVKSVKTIKHNLKVGNGKIIKDHNVYEFDKKTCEYFDKKGNITKVLCYDDLDVRTVLLIPSYNSNNYVTSYKYYDNNNSLMSECLFKYLENGNVIEEWVGSGKNAIQYHLQKNTIENLSYDIEGNLIWKDIYKYDKIGNLVVFCNNLGKTISIVNSLRNEMERIEYDSAGNLFERKKFKYTLDKNKNWIEKSEFLIENNIEKPKIMYERIITYYK